MKKLFHKPFKIIVILLTVISCQSSLNDRSTKIKNEKEKKEINELLKSGKYPSVIQK